MQTNPRTTPPARPGPGPYPGRAELDTANARFRRALARLRREAKRDPALIAHHQRIVKKAARALDRLAAEAETAEQNSERHRRALAVETEKFTRVLRRAARQGSPVAAQMLADHLAQTKGPADGHT